MNDNKEVMEYLKDTFNNINKWLSFAEAKNGSIVVFNTTCIVNVMKEVEYISITNIWCWILCIFCISLLIALYSFKPNTNSIENIYRKRKLNGKRNFLLYSHVAELSPYEYITKLNNEGIMVDRKNKVHTDYIDEIIVNSRISTWKYKVFKKSLCISMVGVTCIILSQIGGWILNKALFILKIVYGL